MQSLAITEVIEKKIHKSIRANAVKESAELRNMVSRMVVEPRAYAKMPTEQERSLILQYAKKERAASWLISCVNLILVAIFSFFAALVSRQKI